MPFFSIITPLYNKENDIKKTINSVLAQSFKDFEFIIINDGSTDKSLEIAESFTDKRIKLFSTKNSGLSATRNFGIKKANTNYIAFIDADDLWLPHHLEQLHNLILSYPNKGIYCTGYTQKRSSKVFHEAVFNNLPENFKGVVPDFFNNSLLNCVAWISAICIPKAIFNKVGVFDPDIYSEQDTDLYIRIALEYEIALDNNSVSAIYNKTDGNSMSNDFYNREIPKLFYAYKIFESKRPSLKKYIDYNRFSYALYFKMSNRPKTYKKLIKDLDKKNLNLWQKLLISLPSFALKLLFFIKNKLTLNSSIIFKPK